jgi:hypothetical protein
MPLYCMRCDACGHQEEVVNSISGRPSPDYPMPCPSCARLAFWRDFQAEAPLHGKAFQPYVEEGFTGKPVEITGPEHRDKLCAQHDVTYDTYSKSSSKPKQQEFQISDSEAHDIVEQVRAGKVPENTADTD